MGMVNIYEAKTNLSRLVDQASAGEEIIIARAGKPVARLVALAPELGPRPLGKFKGQFPVPDDFDTMFEEEIRAMFEDGE
jgi:prevent-host-death family protein